MQLIEANPGVPIRSNEEMVLRITARASFPDPVNFNVKAPRRHRARATSTGQKFGKGGRHLSSRAGYGLVHFESSLERGYIEAFDTSRHVAWYQEQPIEIPYTYLGREASYFPDMMVGLIDGRAVLIEFKGLKHFCYVNTFRKAIVGRRKAFSEGWGYALLYEDGGSIIDLLGRKLPNSTVNLKIIMDSFGHINRSEFFREIRSADEKFSLKDIAALCIQNDFFIETSPWRITKIPNNYTWKMFLP
ncbi:hypothetical protein [Elstera litoralis]|nr:hypothetical protein [Elstera litoralis]